MGLSARAAEVVEGFFDCGYLRLSVLVGTVGLGAITGVFFLIGFVRRWKEKRRRGVRLERAPKITAVMPIKGRRAETLANYTRILQMPYEGPAEFIFVCHSADDPAYECACEAIESVKFEREDREAKVEVAGKTFHNAQKVHNMMWGASRASADSEFCVFIDDDIYIFPGLLEEMVEPLMRDEEDLYASTGYEFVVPKHDGSIAGYCYAIYRLHNLASFMTDKPILCWGGCHMTRTSFYRENKMRLLDCYLDGGYSDDTILSVLIQENGHHCSHTCRSIFSNEPDRAYSLKQYWEFLTRQLFVLKTYCTPFNFRLALSLGFLIVSTCFLILSWAILMIPGGLVVLAGLPSGGIEMGWCTMLPLVDLVLWFLCVRAVIYSTEAMGEISNAHKPKEQHVEVNLCWWKVFVALILQIVMLPLAIIKVLVNEYVLWSGVKYYAKGGKIWKVERLNEDGTVETRDFADSIADAIEGMRIGVGKDGAIGFMSPDTAKEE